MSQYYIWYQSYSERHFSLPSEMANVKKYISGRIVARVKKLSLKRSCKISLRLLVPCEDYTTWKHLLPPQLQKNCSWILVAHLECSEPTLLNSGGWCVHQSKAGIILASRKMIIGDWHWRFSERPESNNISLLTMNDGALCSIVTLNPLVLLLNKMKTNIIWNISYKSYKIWQFQFAFE